MKDENSAEAEKKEVWGGTGFFERFDEEPGKRREEKKDRTEEDEKDAKSKQENSALENFRQRDQADTKPKKIKTQRNDLWD